VDNNDNSAWQAPGQAGTPAPTGPPILPPPSPLIDSQPMFIPQHDAPVATVVPTGTVGKRSKGKVIGGVVAVAALLGGGGFAISKIASGSDGGAASPNEVGTRLIDSLSQEDALGVVDLLLPGERETMRQPLIDIVDNLKRLEVADNTATLSKVGGFDISFKAVHVVAMPTNVGDITNIEITGTGTTTVDGKTVPIGNMLIDKAFNGKRPNMDSDASSSDIDWKLATVNRGGRWYLSAFYSLAEQIRSSSDDIPVTGLTVRGSTTPEGAVQAMFDAVDGLDLEALIGAMNPNEAEALQRYAPIFIDDAQQALDDQSTKIKFSDTKFSVTGSGDRRTVGVDALTMNAEVNGDTITVESKGGCVVVTSNDTTTDSCKSGDSIDTTLTTLGLDDNPDVKALVKTVQDAFADIKPVGITVRQVNGRWFLSPIGTMTDAMIAVMNALDKNELTDIIDGAKKVVDSFLTDGGIFGSVPGIDPTISDPTLDPSTTDPTSTDPASASETYPARPVDDCYKQFDYDKFQSCATAGLQDGSITDSEVSAYFRFPDCGAGKTYFNGDVYGMSDTEFIAFATSVAPCFSKYVDAGKIDKYELPYELYRPDCLEGKNWYKVSDTAYSDRVYACIFG
jgi:hypothetical protein